MDESVAGQGQDKDAAGRSPRGDSGGTRRRRRWGEAARRARRQAAASGERKRRRSLKAIRESQMITQEELADWCDVSRSTISALEKGRRPQPSTARIIAARLEVEVTDIAWGREE